MLSSEPRPASRNKAVVLGKILTSSSVGENWDAMFIFKLAEYLPPFPNATWTLARQAGVTHGV
jgi:hypothetical protein